MAAEADELAARARTEREQATDAHQAKLAAAQTEHEQELRLVADEAQARGTVNHTPVYPREVVKRALELHATALIMVHNHPSGDPTPSRADVEMTAEVKAAAAVKVVSGGGEDCERLAK